MVNTFDLKSNAERFVGSSPTRDTKNIEDNIMSGGSSWIIIRAVRRDYDGDVLKYRCPEFLRKFCKLMYEIFYPKETIKLLRERKTNND